MLGLAKILSFLPFTVNVFGKKRDLIVKIGDFLYSEEKLGQIEIDKVLVDLKHSSYHKILAYATQNLYRDFSKSDLGMYMTKHLKRGSRFVDIGANLGGYSWHAKKMDCEVTLFEPVPELFSVLDKNSSFFGESHQLALSDENSTLTFYTSAKNIGGSSLVQSKNENSGYDGKIQVPVSTFDAFFEKDLLQNNVFDLIKIDVEGNEFKTVKGMEKSLEKRLIKKIWCEVRGHSSDRNPGSYISVSKFLNRYNYSAYRIQNGNLMPFDYQNAQDCPQFFDVLYLYNE